LNGEPGFERVSELEWQFSPQRAGIVSPLTSYGRCAIVPISDLWGDMATPLDLLQGTLDLLVLRTLSSGPMHGYSVARLIKERSASVFLIEEGALYPALHRLERKGYVESEWGVSENNRKAKFYHLTARGRAQLRSELADWGRYTQAVAGVLQPA
jgi:PadR family transcriptional regulator, regulatory protein PadR